MATYVITGANSGLGFETARVLLDRGDHVVLAVRDVAKGEAATARLGGSAEVRELDLASLASIRAFAQGWTEPIAGLVNNAGIMMVAQGTTEDGFERQFGTNHLGHFALTNLLLPHITDRVVTVSSALHRGPQIDFDNLFLDRGYTPGRAYQQSKLANLLFTAGLHRRLLEAGSGVRALAAHPGYADTNLQSHHAVPLVSTMMNIGNRFLAVSAAQGAKPTLMALLEDLPGNTFIGPTKLFGWRGEPGPNQRSEQADDLDAAARLWEVSEDLTGVRFPL